MQGQVGFDLKHTLYILVRCSSKQSSHLQRVGSRHVQGQHIEVKLQSYALGRSSICVPSTVWHVN